MMIYRTVENTRIYIIASHSMYQYYKTMHDRILTEVRLHDTTTALWVDVDASPI
jgi:hypothetical protein